MFVTSTVNPPITSDVNMPVTTSDPQTSSPPTSQTITPTAPARGSSPHIGLASLLGVTGEAPSAPGTTTTPIEDAVHARLRDLEERSAATAGPDGTPAAINTSRAAPIAPVLATVPVAGPARAERPEMPTPTSHMHLVLDEGEERVVVTVAVRGQDVRVSLRGSEDTTAALARNAASLDHGLRQRGLDLARLDIQRDLQRESPREHERPDPGREPERPTDDATPFTLDEAP